MIGIQLIVITFALAAIFFTYTHYKRGDFSGKETMVWIVMWITFTMVALFPETVSPYVQKLGFSRLMDFIAVIAFVVLFGLMLHNYSVVHHLEKRIEELVRKLALKDIDSDVP